MRLQIVCPACRIALDYCVWADMPVDKLKALLLNDHQQNECTVKDLHNARVNKEKPA